MAQDRSVAMPLLAWGWGAEGMGGVFTSPSWPSAQLAPALPLKSETVPKSTHAEVGTCSAGECAQSPLGKRHYVSE